MAYNALNNLIDAYIYANGVQAITGQILNGVLKQMVSQLGSGYHLMGVAGPETTPEQNDFAMAYFAATAGEYTDFGGITLAAGEVAVLLTSGNGSWSKQTIYNVPTGTADLENTAGFITNAVTDLVNYYTKTEVDDTLANYPTLEALATALADYYTKQEVDTTLDDYATKDGVDETLEDYYTKDEVDAELGDRYTKQETDTKLADYYKKTETYDKDEVDSIVAALSRQEYIVAWDGLAEPDIDAIPAGVTVTYNATPYTGTLAASASTVNKIYMVWNGVAYDMYGTSQDGGYSWVPMGTTSVDLSQYATKAELSQLQQKVDGGQYVFTGGTQGKYIQLNGREGSWQHGYISEYYPVNAEDAVSCHCASDSDAYVIAFYDSNMDFVATNSVVGDGATSIANYSAIAPVNGYVRFYTDKARISTAWADSYFVLPRIVVQKDDIFSLNKDVSALKNNKIGTKSVLLSNIANITDNAEGTFLDLGGDPGLFVNGKMYWLAALIQDPNAYRKIDLLQFTTGESKYRVIAFDTQNNTLQNLSYSTIANAAESDRYRYIIICSFFLNPDSVPTNIQGINYTINGFTPFEYEHFIGHKLCHHSTTGSVSEGVVVGDSGEIELSFLLSSPQSQKCLVDMVGANGERFFIDINASGDIVFKIANNAEVTVSRKLFVGKPNKVLFTWDGSNPNNKTYRIIINETTASVGTYTGTVEGTLYIKNEGGWACVEADWFYAKIDGKLVNFNDSFSIVEDPYYNSLKSVFDLNPDIESKIANSARAFHWDESTSTVAQKPLNLLYFSDIHGDVTNTRRIFAFKDCVSQYIDDVLFTGDSDDYPANINWWQGFAKNMLISIGNHEYMVEKVGGVWQYATPQQVYEKFIQPFASHWSGVVFPDSPETGKNYFYKDYDENKLRLVALDYMEINLNPSSTQIAWLTSVLDDTLENHPDYHVLIAVHQCAFLAEQDYKNPFDSLDVRSDSDGVIPVGIPNAVDSFINNGGNFVCYLTGHNHTDHFGLGINFPKQLNISIACATNGIYANVLDIQRELNTKSQDLFNIVSVDTYSSIIKMIRVGCDYDRQLRKKDTICFYYGNEEFDAQKTYRVGKIVNYQNKIYQFTRSYSGGGWNPDIVCEIDRLIYVS